ncbi:MAG TPA: NnrS family protein [Sphingomicrobium sp.]|nr:NnrS family protein [Sphingomicrobium sp.]
MSEHSKVETRGEKMLALRKRRMAATHPFLRGGFRPFFFGAGLWAVIAIALWLCVLAGKTSLPTGFEPVAWHRHEMLFGFVGAAVSGFVLTAIPNWTGRLPIAGRPLLSLFGLWAGARLAVLYSAFLGLWPAALLDVGLFLALGLLAAREVLAAKNRNLPVVGIVLLFGLADALDYAEVSGTISGGFGWRGAILLVTIMISLIGGRIIPSFTRNWMVKQGRKSGLPGQPQVLDLLVIATTAVSLLFWMAFPQDRLTGLMLILAAFAQAIRLSRWGGLGTMSDPLVLILHVGYVWIPIGLLLLGLSLGGAEIPESAGVHALTAGAMTTMIVAVMTRASLGHTARELKAAPLTVVSYASLGVGALLRVAASLGLGPYGLMLDIAGAFWGAALVLFLLVYTRILWGPRLGERA